MSTPRRATIRKPTTTKIADPFKGGTAATGAAGSAAGWAEAAAGFGVAEFDAPTFIAGDAPFPAGAGDAAGIDPLARAGADGLPFPILDAAGGCADAAPSPVAGGFAEAWADEPPCAAGATALAGVNKS
jgi:hypothetical protein